MGWTEPAVQRLTLTIGSFARPARRDGIRLKAALGRDPRVHNVQLASGVLLEPGAFLRRGGFSTQDSTDARFTTGGIRHTFKHAARFSRDQVRVEASNKANIEDG
jgi:hypothetical protein